MQPLVSVIALCAAACADVSTDMLSLCAMNSVVIWVQRHASSNRHSFPIWLTLARDIVSALCDRDSDLTT